MKLYIGAYGTDLAYGDSIRLKGGLETHLSRMIVWSSRIWSFNGKSFSWGPICPWMSLMVWFSHGSVSSWQVSAAALLRAKRTCFAAWSGLSLLFSCWLWHGIFSIRSVSIGLKPQEGNTTRNHLVHLNDGCSCQLMRFSVIHYLAIETHATWRTLPGTTTWRHIPCSHDWIEIVPI